MFPVPVQLEEGGQGTGKGPASLIPSQGTQGAAWNTRQSQKAPSGWACVMLSSFFDVTEPLPSCSRGFVFKPPIITRGVTRKQAPSPRHRVSPSEHLLSSQPKLRSWTPLQTHSPWRLTSTDCLVQAPSPSGLAGFDHGSTRRKPKGRRRERLRSPFLWPPLWWSQGGPRNLYTASQLPRACLSSGATVLGRAQ